jgi:cellulose synthase/poly-beta-1,6-N-acetylglucosamine synthase-like glycosyltransferase
MTAWWWVIVGSSAVLLWTWVLYPALVWSISRFVRVPLRVLPAELPLVTAILATRDEAGTVAERVDDFFQCDYPMDRLQVVVGVDGADAGRLTTIRAAVQSAAVRVVAADAAGGKAAGLNAAVREAKGDVLVFSDAQQRFAPDAIRLLVARLTSDTRVDVVGGALQLPGDRPDAPARSPVEWYWRFERELRAAESRLHSSVGVSGSIYAMWRRAWLPMPEQLILDDVWLPMRLVLAGRRVGYELDAKAWDARRTSATQEKVRKVRTLTGNFQLIAWLPALLVPIRNPIWLQFVSHKLLRLVTPWVLLTLIIGCIGAVAAMVSPAQLAAFSAVLAIAVAAILMLPRTSGPARRALAWGWSLQTAIVRATVNGLQGRWDVWK